MMAFLGKMAVGLLTAAAVMACPTVASADDHVNGAPRGGGFSHASSAVMADGGASGPVGSHGVADKGVVGDKGLSDKSAAGGVAGGVSSSGQSGPSLKSGASKSTKPSVRSMDDRPSAQSDSCVATDGQTSGTWGTTTWTIAEDSDNSDHCVVNVGGGVTGSSDEAPWRQVDDYGEIITKIVFKDPVTASAKTAGLFSGLSVLEEIDGLGEIDTSQLTDMSSMFAGDSMLADVRGLSRWTVSSVKNMS
ncbi:BspA family leucine-rich repeat surface protein, partial [Bifidobacterium bohemicum]